ncbi:hypothetical protein H920_02480 [Fukomys damarensis]|uniref:Uncharacterized protein n=1 Tax=Fukomys damarensis TaxID=885580 RepID=A0A091EKM2_FUKDA|nr:hypothetical protein H920_02480 [Fukomys damarensis]
MRAERAGKGGASGKDSGQQERRPDGKADGPGRASPQSSALPEQVSVLGRDVPIRGCQPKVLRGEGVRQAWSSAGCMGSAASPGSKQPAQRAAAKRVEPSRVPEEGSKTLAPKSHPQRGILSGPEGVKVPSSGQAEKPQVGAELACVWRLLTALKPKTKPAQSQAQQVEQQALDPAGPGQPRPHPKPRCCPTGA